MHNFPIIDRILEVAWLSDNDISLVLSMSLGGLLMDAIDCDSLSNSIVCYFVQFFLSELFRVLANSSFSC